MKSILVEEHESGKRAYESVLVDPKGLSILNNDLALKIIGELVKQPACALDIARSLGIHEQKVYYHIRKLDAAGIIQPARTEKRFGMTAKIYEAVSPVVATKLFDEGYPLKDRTGGDLRLMKFLSPFIEKGKLNATVVIGNPYPHGKFDAGGLDGCYVADLSITLGSFLHSVTFPSYKLDIRVTDDFMKHNNLIVIGHPMGNTVAYKLNKLLPLYFDEHDGWAIVSKKTGKRYADDQAGVVIRCKNPFNKDKHILYFAGRRTRGTETAIMAFTRYASQIIGTGDVARVVHGIDEDGDAIIDSVKVLE
ncbi:MAG: winged helix-turn-helix transcriptional regulator [Candidatus Aenigmarchaeota archaeon]|nr:winged helix-turn-helix transcriptional regulator [Candidatus Aenigmarchaeota archaeon]